MTEEMKARARAFRLWYEEQLRLDQEHAEECIEMQPCECPELGDLA